MEQSDGLILVLGLILTIEPQLTKSLLIDLAKNVKNKNTLKFHNCINNAAKNLKIVFQMWSVNNLDRGCQNCSQCEQFWWCVQQKFSNLFQSFSFSQFFTYKFTACSQSCLVYSLVRVGTFSCLFHSLVRVGRFFLSKLPPWTISTKKEYLIIRD